MLKQFMEQLSLELGLSGVLEPLEDGSYSLPLEPNLQISLRENPQSGITMGVAIAPLPVVKREEFLVKAMSANLFGRETGGALVGLDKDGKQLTMTCFIPEQESYKYFRESLEDFANYADSWREETAEFVQKASEKEGI